MKYYEFIAKTGYAGCVNYHYEVFEDDVDESELIDIAEDLAEEVAQDYSYIALDGFDEEEDDEETLATVLEDFRSDCYCEFSEITKERYEAEINIR